MAPSAGDMASADGGAADVTRYVSAGMNSTDCLTFRLCSEWPVECEFMCDAQKPATRYVDLSFQVKQKEFIGNDACYRSGATLQRIVERLRDRAVHGSGSPLSPAELRKH